MGGIKYYHYFHLPEEIIMDMLSRLPVKSVLRCSLVCKTWRRIVYNPSFAHMHLQRRLDDDADHGKLNVLLFIMLKNRGHQFRYALEDENCEESYEKILKRLNFKPDHPNYYDIVGSCNGMICISDRSNGKSIYICNPITRECLYLPISTNQSSGLKTMNMVSGFGYLPSTNEYKVVTICYWEEDKYLEGRVQVYTLGSGTGWREKGRINLSVQTHRRFPAILANGALHWLEDELRILAFDLADEEFLLLPSPPFLLDDDPELYYKLEVLGGQLCAVHYKNEVSVDVWALKKNKTGKNGNQNMKVQNKYQFWSWIQEFSMESDMKAPYPTPITITKHGQVLFYSDATLSRYDLRTANSENLVDIEKYYSSAVYGFEAIPHLNSFVSLKALGEEDIKVIESDR